MTSTSTDHPVDSSTRVFRGGVFSLAGGIIAALGGLLLTVVVARGLGTTRTGVFFVSLGLFTILSNTLELGADTGLVRFVPRLRALGRTADLKRTVIAAAVPVVLASCVTATLVTVYAGPLARVFMEQHSVTLGSSFLRSVAPYLAVAPVATVLIAGTRGFGRVTTFVLVQNVGLPLSRPLAIVLLVAAGVATDHWVATAWGLPWVIACAVAVMVLARQLRRAQLTDRQTEPAQSARVLAREFWSFSAARGFAGAADVTLVWLDVLLVGWLVGPLQAGIYATASRFVTSGSLVLQASRIAISPRLSRLLSTNRNAEAEQLFNTSARVVIAASWPLYIGLACFAPVVLRLFGHGFGKGAMALTVLSLAMLIDTATGNIGTVLLMSGRSSWNLVNSATGLVVDVVADVLLIPHYGATGAAIGWGVSIAVINAMACFEVGTLMRLRIVESSTAETALGAALCFGLPGIVLRAAGGDSAWGPALWLLVGVSAYACWGWVRRDRLRLTQLGPALGLGRDSRLNPAEGSAP
jgi:O-antigen/teichoic acid export membrane protein